jgi:voltage-gated potassium channel
MTDEASHRESLFPPRRKVAATLARATIGVVLLLVLYAVLPLGAAPVGAALLLLGLGLIAFAALIVRQFVAIGSAEHPGLRAAEALAVAITLFLVLFAATYFRWSETTPGAFSEHLTRISAFYFTVTTFATVGFGDITATADGSRLLVTAQIVADLLVLGLVVNAFVTSARRARATRRR